MNPAGAKPAYQRRQPGHLSCRDLPTEGIVPMDENPYQSPAIENAIADPTRVHCARFVIDERLQRSAIRLALCHTGFLHHIIAGLLAVVGMFALFQLLRWDLIESIVHPGIVLETFVLAFVGTFVGAYFAGTAALGLNVRLRSRRLKRREGVGGLRAHLVTLSQFHVTVAADQDVVKKELTTIRILKHPHFILVLGFGAPLPIPDSAHFGDVTFAEFFDVLRRRRRLAWWSVLRG